MALAALIVWIITASGGFYLLVTWIANGGLKGPGSSRIRPILIFSHPALAGTGLVFWIIYVAEDNDTFGWIAFALLLGVATLGLTMLATWVPTYRSDAGADGPAEGHFPVPIVGGHGALALTTLVLVLLANLGVGGS